MKSLLCAGIASCALALLVPMQHAFSEEEPSSPATEREVLQAVDKYRSAILKRDTAALEQIWADDYTFVNGAGEMLSKAQRLQNIKSGATSLDSVTQGDDVKVRIYRDTGSDEPRHNQRPIQRQGGRRAVPQHAGVAKRPERLAINC
jgi:hypothetical protein